MDGSWTKLCHKLFTKSRLWFGSLSLLPSLRPTVIAVRYAAKDLHNAVFYCIRSLIFKSRPLSWVLVVNGVECSFVNIVPYLNSLVVRTILVFRLSQSLRENTSVLIYFIKRNWRTILALYLAKRRCRIPWGPLRRWCHAWSNSMVRDYSQDLNV